MTDEGADIPAILDAADEIHGFYGSHEGRTLLRSAFSHYVERVKGAGLTMGSALYQIAKSIADNSSIDPHGEVRATQLALTRWIKNGSDEIWKKEAQKNIRIAKRLEVEMMREPDISEILGDLAADTYKADLVGALSRFFYRIPASSKKLQTPHDALNAFCGVYEVFYGSDIDKHQPDAVSDTEIGFVSWSTFWKVSRPHQSAFLLIQEFELANSKQPSSSPYRERKAGFMFLGATGQFTRFMVGLAQVGERWIEMFEPTAPLSRYRLIGGPIVTENDIHYKSARVAVHQMSEVEIKVDKQRTEDRKHILRRVTGDLKWFVDKRFSGRMWNIPL